MKIIHCADLHLDSKMESILSKEKARERKNEILMTFLDMVEYARKNWVSAVIIAGDMCDTANVSLKVQNIIIDAIRSNPGISFLILRGNHDAENFLYSMENPPENLYFFANEWTRYDFADVAISGVELTPDNKDSIYDSLSLETRRKNIVVLHGQTVSDGTSDAELISLKRLKDKGIDYLALGHIHSYKEEVLDERGVAVYPGCLEGRGFDECGEKGFVLVEIKESVLTYQFVPIAKRILRQVVVDVSGATSTAAILAKVKDALHGEEEKNLMKVVLIGELPLDGEKNISMIDQYLESTFYFGRCKDLTKVSIPVKEYEYDPSLRGEFIRRVLHSDMSEEMKASVLHLGMAALAGEEPGQ